MDDGRRNGKIIIELDWIGFLLTTFNDDVSIPNEWIPQIFLSLEFVSRFGQTWFRLNF